MFHFLGPAARPQADDRNGNFGGLLGRFAVMTDDEVINKDGSGFRRLAIRQTRKRASLRPITLDAGRAAAKGRLPVFSTLSAIS